MDLKVLENTFKFEESPNPKAIQIFDWSTPNNALRSATILANSGMVPKEYQGQPAKVMVAVTFGNMVNIPPLLACSSICVINGTPSVWGDAFLGLCLSAPSYESHSIDFDKETMTATVMMKRKGCDPHAESYDIERAKANRLWGKSGPWTDDPQTMLTRKAIAKCGRLVFADHLRGFHDTSVLIEEIGEDGTYKQTSITPPSEASKGKTLAEKLRAKKENVVDINYEESEPVELHSTNDDSEDMARVQALSEKAPNDDCKRAVQIGFLTGLLEEHDPYGLVASKVLMDKGLEDINELSDEQIAGFIAHLPKMAEKEYGEMK